MDGPQPVVCASMATGDRTSVRLVLDAPFKVDDGYGTAAEEILLQLDSLGVDVYPTHWSHTTLDGLKPRTIELLRRGWAPEHLGMRMSQPNTAKRCPSTVRTLFSMWEFSRLPASWIEGANSVAVNFVPSTFCRDLWLDGGVTTPIVVAPLGVSDDYKYQQRQNNTFTFCQAGTLGKRKNAALTVSAFKKAFTKEDVYLVVKSSPDLPFYCEPDSRIIVINQRFSRADMIRLLGTVDCFVYPTHGEGFGLSVAEAMATGLPCIVPIHTGLADFVQPEYCYQVNTKPVDANHPLGPMDTQWIDEDHLVSLMRHVYNHRDEARQKGKLASQAMKQWTWNRTANTIVNALHRAEYAQ